MNSNLATTTWLQAIIRFTIGSDISASKHNLHFTAHKSLHQINSVLQTLGQRTTETFFLFGWPLHLMPPDAWHKFWFSEVHLLHYAWESMTLPHLSRVLSEYIYCTASCLVPHSVSKLHCFQKIRLSHNNRKPQRALFTIPSRPPSFTTGQSCSHSASMGFHSSRPLWPPHNRPRWALICMHRQRFEIVVAELTTEGMVLSMLRLSMLMFTSLHSGGSPSMLMAEDRFIIQITQSLRCDLINHSSTQFFTVISSECSAVADFIHGDKCWKLSSLSLSQLTKKLQADCRGDPWGKIYPHAQSGRWAFG